MAEDDNGKTTGSAERSVPHVDAKPASTGFDPSLGAVTPSAAGATDWTASDARGPLSEAGHGIERLYPSETEAPSSGVIDTGKSEPAVGSESVAHAAAPPQIEPSVASPQRSFWPVAAGVVVGALIGAGSAAIVYRSFDTGPNVESSVSALAARVDSVEKRPDANQALAELKSTVAGLDGKIADLNGRLKAVESKPAAAPAADAPLAPTFDPAPLQQKIAGQQQQLDALQKQGVDTKGLQDKVMALDAKLATVGTQATAAEASITSLQSGQKSLAAKITSAPALAVVADSLVQQIDQGRPYAAQVDALIALGADPAAIAVLRQNADKGVPSVKELAAKFEPLAEPIAAIEHRPPPNAGFVDRLRSGMFSVVSIRRADEVGGDDLASRVARLQASLAHDDVADALATWNALPAEAKAKADAWGALAKTHAEAMKAAQDLRQQAIAALGSKKS